MQQRIILYVLVNQQILFFIPLNGFTATQKIEKLSEFSQKNNLTRCDSFDWAVGNRGLSCTLLNGTEPYQHLPKLPFSEFPQFIGTWLSFPRAAKTLTDGDDKRFLQLAVQYISTGGIDNSVIASEYDKEFLESIKQEITKPIV